MRAHPRWCCYLVKVLEGELLVDGIAIVDQGPALGQQWLQVLGALLLR